MFCYIRRDLSTYLQLSLCLSALLNWGQYFSSPSVSLTLTVPDIQEIQTGVAVFTYDISFPFRQWLHLLCSMAKALWVAGSGHPMHLRALVVLPIPWDPHATVPMGSPVERPRNSHASKSMKTPPRSLLCLYFYWVLHQDIFP